MHSGEALKAARADISDQTRSRQIAQSLPRALDALIAEPDPLLLELLQAKVADFCGYQPRFSSSCRTSRAEEQGTRCPSHEKPKPAIG